MEASVGEGEGEGVESSDTGEEETEEVAAGDGVRSEGIGEALGEAGGDWV